MTALLLVVASVVVLALLVGAVVVMLGMVLMGVVLYRRRGAAETGVAPEPAPVAVPESQASPVPLTRLVSASGGLRPAPDSPTPPPPPSTRPVAPTLAPEADDGTEPFGDLAALFDRLDRASEEDSTELLSREERVRLYGFDIGNEEGPPRSDHQVVEED